MSEKVGIKDNDKVSKKDIFLKELSRKAFHLLGGLSIPSSAHFFNNRKQSSE